MPKGIKKRGKIAIIILASIILLLVTPIILLKINKVQSFIIAKVTESLEKKLETNIEIGDVKFQLFNRLRLDDILIEDQSHDTLIYSESLELHIAILPLFQREVRLYDGSLNHASIHLVTQLDGSNNLQFILNAFKSTKKRDPFNLDLKHITLKDSRLHYIDYRGDISVKEEIFNSKNILLSNLNFELAYQKEQNKMFGGIKELSFQERSGFSVKQLSTTFEINDSIFNVPYITLRTPNSYAELKNIWLSYDSLKNLKEQLPNIGINLEWMPSYINLPDFKYFVPQLANFQKKASIQGALSGKINNIKLSQLIVSMGPDLALNGDLEVNGFPNIKDAFIFSSLNAITFNKASLQDLIANITRRPFTLPHELNNLGLCEYSGKITGFINNLVLYGKLKTQIGTITTDVSLESVDSFNLFYLKGNVKSNNVRLGQLLPKSELGTASFNITTNIETGRDIPLMIKASMQVPTFSFRNYTYNDIKLNGKFEKKEFIGSILLNDPNGYLDFVGEINLDKQERTFKFDTHLAELNLHALHLIKTLPNLKIGANIHSNFSGQKLESMLGQVDIDSVSLINNTDSFTLNKFELVASQTDEYRVKLQSDLINGELQGKFALSDIATNGKLFLSRYLSVLNPPVFSSTTSQSNQIEFSLEIEPLSQLCRTLEIPWYTTQTSNIYGKYDDINETLNFEVLVPNLSNGKQNINGIYLSCHNDDVLSVELHASAPMKRDTLDAIFNIDLRNDSIRTLLQWDNHNGKSLFAGEFLANTYLFKKSDSLHAKINIAHTEFELQNKPWTIQNSFIETNFKQINIDKLEISSKDQNLSINGVASKNSNDSILINLLNINLDFINNLIPNLKTIKFGGDVTGTAAISSVFNHPQINADIHATNFSFNDTYLGSAKVTSYFDLENHSIVFLGDIINDTKDTTATLNGNYFILKDSLDILAEADNLNMGFINFYTKSIFNDIQGHGFGNVHIYGITKSKNIAIDADAYISNAKLSVGFLNTSYYFSDSLHMDRYGLKFDKIEISDQEGHKGFLNGNLSYNYFKDMRFKIDITPNKMLVLNTTRQDFSNFYGKAYASGLVQIEGNEKDVLISCRATTEQGTKIYIPIDSYYASDNSFITFTTPEKEIQTSKDTKNKDNLPKSTNLVIDLMLDVNTNAEVQLQIDSKAGDMIKGTGNGNLKITYDMLSSALKMYGTYTIEKGEYLFTFQNVIRKYFHVKDGSSLSWSGNPINPTIDINAYYQLSASLVDILNDATLTNAARNSVAVQCLLNLSGNLMQPNIKFDINLPNSDEDLNRAVKNAISTDEQMNRQIIGLLLLGKFINPETLQNASTFISSNELFSVVSSTLSSQLNSWASQLFENWNFGINFRTSGEGDTRSNEYELNFLYTPNNRIEIIGNVGYRDDNLSATKFIGDFDIEYKLNRSGKLRAKAYTHTNDYKEFKKGLTTQGIGLIYRESFNSLPQLWQSWNDSWKNSKQERAVKKEEKKKKKEEKKAAKEATKSNEVHIESTATEKQ